MKISEVNNNLSQRRKVAILRMHDYSAITKAEEGSRTEASFYINSLAKTQRRNFSQQDFSAINKVEAGVGSKET